jgi:alpha-tubulin suppressor-like RCC1 family protein
VRARVLASLAFVLAACGSPRTSGAPTSVAPAIVAPPPRPSAVVDPARETAGPLVPPTPRQGFVQIAVGLDVSCAVLDDHTARCWGSNANGRAGLGETPSALVPTRVGGLPPVQAIAVGDAHACALDLEGHVHCWGENDYGQLGDGTTSERHAPGPVPDLAHVVEIDVARSHTCARLESGHVRCWGRALHVGSASAGDRLTPIDVPGITDAIEVVLGPENGCVIRADHTTMCWGFNGGGVFGSRPGPFARPTHAFRDAQGRDLALAGLALGDRHVCITVLGGHTDCAGANEYGQLMDQWIADDARCERTGESVECTWQDPVPVDPPPPPGSPPPPPRPDIYPPPPRHEPPTHTERFTTRSGWVVSHLHARVVVADGQYAMGRTCVITDTDEVECYGRTGHWDWGHRRATPITLARGARQLDVAPHHACAVLADGRALCWGENRAGQLGDGTTDSRHDGTFVTW